MTQTLEQIAVANAEVERLCHELDITNASHIGWWLEAHDYDPSPFLAVAIVQAYERAILKEQKP